MPLQTLYCGQTKVRDLTPLKGMKLTLLNLDLTQISDLSPLAGMPLKELQIRPFPAGPDAEILRSITTLEQINGKPAAEFWREVSAAQQGKKVP
jgi:hypothetical protein